MVSVIIPKLINALIYFHFEIEGSSSSIQESLPPSTSTQQQPEQQASFEKKHGPGGKRRRKTARMRPGESIRQTFFVKPSFDAIGGDDEG